MLISDNEKKKYYDMFYKNYIKRIFYIGIDYEDIKLSYKYYRIAKKIKFILKIVLL